MPNPTQVKEHAYGRCESDDDPLDFYSAARELGYSEDDAADLDEIMTECEMRERGAI